MNIKKWWRGCYHGERLWFSWSLTSWSVGVALDSAGIRLWILCFEFIYDWRKKWESNQPISHDILEKQK